MNKTKPAIGFTAIWGGAPEIRKNVVKANDRTLSHFEELENDSLKVGETQLEIWGRNHLSDSFHYLPDGSLLLLVGSPMGDLSWAEVEKLLGRVSSHEEFELPWDGRVILFKISKDGRCWTMWNDWLGSIPVFYTHTKHGRVSSTLEPVVVAGGGLTADNFYSPAVVSLLTHGHFLGDWTLKQSGSCSLYRRLLTGC